MRREIGKSNVRISLFKRSIKNLNLTDFSYIKQVDGQMRLRETKLALWRIGFEKQALSTRSCKRECQAIEELRRLCCEETDRARQAGIDEVSLHQERNSMSVTQIVDSNSGIFF